MRREPIEIALAGKLASRRRAKRMLRSLTVARLSTMPVPARPTTDVIDEAFAGLSPNEVCARRIDPAAGDRAEKGDSPRRSQTSSVVTQLAAQLDALDRQREQLARLLRDVEVASLAD